jgi:hypothetical protein
MKTSTKVAFAAVVALAAAGQKNAPAVTHAVTHAVNSHAHAVTDVIAAAPDGPGETAFFKAVLADLHAPAGSAADIKSLQAWYPHEYSTWPPAAANNPLDSTLWEPGAWAFNTIYLSGGGVLHVWNYSTAAEGAQANADTIANGSYPNIEAALQSGRGFCGDPSVAPDLNTWSGDTYSTVNC